MKNLFLLGGVLLLVAGNLWGSVGGVDNLDSFGGSSRGASGPSGDRALNAQDHIDCGTVDNYIAYQLLDNLVPGDTKPLSVNYDQGSNAIRVEVSRFVSNCMKIEPSLHPYGGDYFIIMKNTYFEEMRRQEPAKYNELYANKTARQMYESCLVNEGAMKDGDWTDQVVPSNVQSFTFKGIDLNDERPTNFYFGSNKQELGESLGGYSVVHGSVDVDKKHECFDGEKIQEEDLYLFKNAEQRRAHEYFRSALLEADGNPDDEDDCPSCEYDALAKVFTELQSRTGNASVLEEWMRRAFIDEMTKKLNTMYDERAEQIDEKLDALDDKIKGADNRDEASEYVKEYMDLLEELDEKYLSNQIILLEDMYDCKADVTLKKEQRDQCEGNVEKLLDNIKKFSSKHYLSDGVLRKMQKLGFASEANEAKHFALRAKYYGRYDGKDPRKPLKKIEDDMEKFERKTLEYEREYLARHEGEVFSDMYEDQISSDQQRIQSLNKQYQTFIQETQTACQQTMFGYANPTKCKRNMEKAQQVQQSWQKKVGILSARIQKYGGVYEKYKGLEDAYAAESSDYDDEFDIWDDDILYYERYDDSSSSSSNYNWSANMMNQNTMNNYQNPMMNQSSMYNYQSPTMNQNSMYNYQNPMMYNNSMMMNYQSPMMYNNSMMNYQMPTMNYQFNSMAPVGPTQPTTQPTGTTGTYTGLPGL